LKLQTKILLFILPLVVLPLVALGWFAYDQLQENARRQHLAAMETALDQLQRAVIEHRRTAEANAVLFANSALVQKYVLTGDEATRFRLMQPPLLRLFASYQSAYPDYYQLRILLPDGYEDTRSTLSRLPNASEDESDWWFFRELADTGSEVLGRYGIDPDTGRPALFVGRPLRLRDDSFESSMLPPRLRGYLVITAALDSLRERIDALRVGQDGFLFAALADGTPLLQPGRVEASQLDAALRAAAAPEATSLDEDGRAPFHVARRDAGEGLWLVAALPAAEVRAAGRSLGIGIAVITTLTALAAGFFVFVLIHRMLVAPIDSLGRAAQAIGHGNLDIDIDVDNRDELGALARVFESMSRNLRESRDQATYLAHHDALTGLPNRRMFQEYLQRALSHAQRHEEHLALLFLDLDNFKQVNDTMGHQAGDALLTDLADRLTECLRREDPLLRLPATAAASPMETVARVGGDEFLVLLPHLGSGADAALVARRILQALERPFRVAGTDFHCSTSIGISVFPEDGRSVPELIKNADIAMYHAKDQGRNNYQYFDASLNQAAMERLTMENALREAIEKGQFLLHYQPKLDLASGRIRGAEALIRWHHPGLGMVPPVRFIPTAEASGLIAPIGEWVIRTAVAQAAEWHRQGLELELSINISTVQLNRQNVCAVLADALRRSGCPPQRLEIELTETSIMQAHESATSMLEDIRALGVRISMDDFGVGYSSFSYLRNLPIDILKIDRSFVRDIISDPDDAAIISAILAMAHTLGLEVIAEGVETEAQRDFLRQHDCDLIQGYLISRPLPADEFAAFIGGFPDAGKPPTLSRQART